MFGLKIMTKKNYENESKTHTQNLVNLMKENKRLQEDLKVQEERYLEIIQGKKNEIEILSEGKNQAKG